jgi:hypothetical protein
MYQKQKPSKPKDKQKTKWATFTHYGTETRVITKLFKNTNTGISYRTKNNTKHHLEIKRNATKNNEYNLSGVYELQRTECPESIEGKQVKLSKRDTKNI